MDCAVASQHDGLDLRRRRTREMAEVLVGRAEWLGDEDRAIVSAVYQDGISAKDLANIRGQSPRCVRRRIHALVQRITSDEFAFVLRARDQWPPTRRRVATACVLRGMSLREAGDKLGLSLHAVRKHMDAVRALHSAELR